MLPIGHSDSRTSRRDFLRGGTLSLGGLSLSQMLAGTALGAQGSPHLTGKSVIFVHMHGGPSQFETFDPKMTAPASIRTITGEIQTRIPGVTFGSTFPRLAQLADKLAIVRSFVPGDAGHDAKPIVHHETLRANLGSFYSRVAGLTNPTTGMPRNILLYPHAVTSDAAAPSKLADFAATGPLGTSYAPFNPGSGSGDLQQDMRLNIPSSRLDERRALLVGLDTLKRKLHGPGALEQMDRFQEQALSVVLGGAAHAFDLTREDPRVLARYDTAGLVKDGALKKSTTNVGVRRHYKDHAHNVGKMLLLARRLCEAGAGFVTVNAQYVWDMHGVESGFATMKDGMDIVGRPFDHALSALIEDLEARGLTDKILVVCCGEMGRTPIIERGGRNHWGDLGPLLLYGGGLKMGQVIGRSTPDGGEPASDPVHIRNLIATIMHTLFDVGQVRLLGGIPSNVSRVITEGDPIASLT